jgi:uncharacterized protein (DUF1015 family)
MAQFQPFAASRPHPDYVNRVSCPPYDVLTLEQAKHLGLPVNVSLLHAILPEIDGEGGLDELTHRGATFLQQLIADSSVMTTDNDPTFYIYEQTQAGKTRTGFFGCVSTDDYENGTIVRHELTRPNKVEERTRHILAQSAHAEPVMLVYRNSPSITAVLKSAKIDAIPLYDFVDEQNVRHRLFMADPDMNADISAAFQSLNIYIADGHHRCHAAWEAARRLSENDTSSSADAYEMFPAVLLPDDELMILPYNRYLQNLDDIRFEELESILDLKPSKALTPSKPGDMYVGTADGWWSGKLPHIVDPSDLLATIDAERLQNMVLSPLYNIQDIRTDYRVGFSGGYDSVAVMQDMLDSGQIQLAFSLYPVSIQQLLDISDASLLMPPKSTWFEPKLRSGLLIHTF